MRNKKCKLFAVLAAGFLIFSGSFIFRTSAATSYKGKGTQSNPYIVETAEQLDGIRNNLKAHYKLGNTIDLSGIASFKPIGDLSSGFTGSLSCDLDTSGKPEYAIKGLKVNVAPAGCTKAEGFSGYKEKKSGWEAGLFGYASGASFKNILVLDATVNSKVEGCYKMNSDYTLNPGTEEQAAGILIAIGEKLTVSGCGVSGNVTSASNHVGGMAGKLIDSKVNKCYSYANVTSTGSWGSGGLVGSISGTTKIATSFYSGTFSGGLTHAGAFAGSVYGKTKDIISDCWASGTVKTSDSGCFLGTKNHSDTSSLTNIDVAKNCYTLAKIEGRKNAQTNKKVTNGNYITDEVGGFEAGFAAASQAEMNAAFSSLSNWTIADGSYPQIKGLVPVSDSSAFTVGAISDNQQNTEGDSQTDNSDNSAAVDTKTDGNSNADIEVKTVFNNEMAKLKGFELGLVIALSILVFATFVGAVIIYVLTIKKTVKSKKIKTKDIGGLRIEE